MPSSRDFDDIAKRISKFIDDYAESLNKDFNDFLDIELDIEIEEARKLHRIDHYLNFLKMAGNFEDLAKKLNELKENAQKWIYQDSVDAKTLIRYANAVDYGLLALKKSKAAANDPFPGILAVNIPINFDGIRVNGILMHSKDKPKPNRAVVLVHGAFSSKKAMVTLGKRLASQGYWVYSIDLTSHGESLEKLNLGRSSEYILATVKWFRLNGFKNVGVIGHSLGGVITLFALSGYNTKIESNFYDRVTLLQKLIDKLSKDSSQGEVDYSKHKYDMIRMSEEFTKLKMEVLQGMKSAREGIGKIDAAVFLGIPRTVQFVLKPWQSNILKRIPKFVMKILTKNIVNPGRIKKWVRQGGEQTPTHGILTENDVQFWGAVIADVKYTFTYTSEVKNPYDYLALIDFICDKTKNQDNKAQFFNYFRNMIRATPKLYFYGLSDQLLKPMEGKNMLELEGHYRSFGATEIVRYPDIDHGLNKEGEDKQLEAGKLPEMTYKIVNFLNNYLGAGKLP